MELGGVRYIFVPNQNLLFNQKQCIWIEKGTECE